MADNFKIKVYTPEGSVVEDATTELLLETSDGQVTLLPEHCNYTTMLGAGVLRFTSSESHDKHEFVTCGGFANFNDNEVLILTDSVDFAKDIDTQSLIEQSEKLATQMANADFNDPETKYIKEQLQRAYALQQLVSH